MKAYQLKTDFFLPKNSMSAQNLSLMGPWSARSCISLSPNTHLSTHRYAYMNFAFISMVVKDGFHNDHFRR